MHNILVHNLNGDIAVDRGHQLVWRESGERGGAVHACLHRRGDETRRHAFAGCVTEQQTPGGAVDREGVVEISTDTASRK